MYAVSCLDACLFWFADGRFRRIDRQHARLSTTAGVDEHNFWSRVAPLIISSLGL
jgi:hypothetical protein